MVDKERALEALGHIDPELIERMEVQKKRRLPRAPARLASSLPACAWPWWGRWGRDGRL